MFATTLILQLLSGTFSLRIIRLDIPGAVRKGQPIWLNCSFDLESDKLYSVKWYKDNSEFYRYLPSDIPSTQKYQTYGVYIDLARCYQGHVYLYRTDLNTEGTYRCEVSGESPSFQTVQEENDIHVYAIPDERPIVRIMKFYDKNDEDFEITCRSKSSKPAASLYWYINQQKTLLHYEPELAKIFPSTQLYSSAIEIRLSEIRENYPNRLLMVQCVASYILVSVIASNEYYITNCSKPLLATSSRNQRPVIKGLKDRYIPGDLLRLNCSAPMEMGHSKLKWFINQREATQENLVLTEINHTGEKLDVIGLKIVIRPNHFQKGMMRLKCSAISTSSVLRTSHMKLFNNGESSFDFFAVSHRNTALVNEWDVGVYIWNSLLLFVFKSFRNEWI